MRYSLYLLLSLLTLCTSVMTASDAEGLTLGISAGVAVPDGKMTQAYDLVRRADEPLELYDAATGVGLHLGARARLGLTEHLSLIGGIDINRFLDEDQRITLRNGDVLVLASSTDLIPVYGGVQLFLGRWLVAPYVSGSVSYTYRRVTVSEVGANTDFEDILLDRGIEVEPTVSRFGGRLAAGIAIELGPLHPFLEVGYTATNVVGRAADEPLRTFVHVSAGITF